MSAAFPDIVVAPMAGGPTTPALVAGAARAGAVGFLAAGYKTPAVVEDELRALQGVPHGLNVFVPSPPLADPRPIERYRSILQVEADRYDIELPPVRVADDDHYDAKIHLAAAYAVPIVSFTFGVPEAAVVRSLRSAGCSILITVTSAEEAYRALAVEPDGLVAQAGSAGGHASTTNPAAYTGTSTALEVLASVRATTELPIIVAGGTAGAADVRTLLGAGAAAVQCGTWFLLADEAGTRPAQRTALQADADRSTGEDIVGGYHNTVVTRAFTGQPARALRNRFTEAYTKMAPIGYPAVHHLTAPIRAAAAARGDAEALNLWAGTGHAAVRPGPVAELIAALRE